MLQDQPEPAFIQGLQDKGSDCPVVGVDVKGREEEETTEAETGWESEVVNRGGGPPGHRLPALDPGLPRASRHQGKHQEADQEPCQVYQCLLENGRRTGSWRASFQARVKILECLSPHSSLPHPVPPRAPYTDEDA